MSKGASKRSASHPTEGHSIECVTAAGDVDELVSAFRDSGTVVACLCASDKVYAELAEPAARALREAGATLLWLAGDPDRVATEGVDGYLQVGCDALAVLHRTFEASGVS